MMPTPFSGEDDLVKVNLRPPVATKKGASVTLSLSGDARGNLKVWSGPSRGKLTEVLLGWKQNYLNGGTPVQEFVPSIVYPDGAGVPASVWVEGIGTSGAKGDLALSLSATDAPQGPQSSSSDVVKITVPSITITPKRLLQDSPTDTTFGFLTPEPDGKLVVYGGSEPGTSDDLTLTTVVGPAGLFPVNYNWSVSDPTVVQNAPPAGGVSPTYNAGNVAAKPGDVKFEVTLGLDGDEFKATTNIEVGVRTDDVIISSWINPSAVPALTLTPAIGVDVSAAFPTTGAPTSSVDLAIAADLLF